MTDYAFTENRLGQTHIELVHTSAQVPVGTRIKARSRTYGEGEFIYLLGVTSTTSGNMVKFDPSTFQTALSPNTAGTGNAMAVSMGATTAAAKYGWYAVAGVVPVKKTATQVTAGVAVFQSATTGRIMPTVATGKQVLGARSANTATVTTTTSTVLVHLEHPHIQGVQ